MTIKRLPKKIRLAGTGHIYELVQTEAPTAGGTRLKTLHRAEDDEEEATQFSQLTRDWEIPSLDKIEKGTRSLFNQMENLRTAFDEGNIDNWVATLKEFVKRAESTAWTAKEELRKLTG